jgi:phosphoserine phosphatase RsbU/P
MKDKPVIMIVDDEPQNIELLEAFLVSEDYDIVRAVNGEDALEKLSVDQIDLILLDVMMPGMDGFEVIIRVRRHAKYRLLPIILVTALREKEDRVRGIEAGCDDFISKPVDKIELLARVRSLLRVKAYNDLLNEKQREIDLDFAQASLVQKTILTQKSVYGSIKGLEIDVQYLPMNGSISGDYYNISLMKDGIASILIADASGHGIQAALSTMQIDLLNRDSLVIEYPYKRMEQINWQLVERLSSKNFFTGFLVHLHHDRLYYSSAGHPPQLLIRPSSGEIVPLKARGKVIGIFDDCEYEMKEEKIAKGDVLFLFTDGLFEEFNSKWEEWGEEGVTSFLKSRMGELAEMPIDQWGQMLLDEMNRFCGGTMINDDITIVCIRML